MTLLAATSLHAVDPSALTPLSSIPPAGTFLSLAQTNWAPMPADPFPQLNLYTDGTNFYYDDRGVDLSALTPFASPAAQSNVRVAGAEDVPPPPYPGPGPFTGTGSVASAAQFYPPSTNYVACESYTNFWLTISISSGEASITITNTLPYLSYELLEKPNLSQPDWTPLCILTATGDYVRTNVSVGTNTTYFYQARLTTDDQAPVITEALEQIDMNHAGFFEVTAAGVGPLSYQWRLNGTNLVDGANVSGTTTSAMTITNPVTNGATYSVIVADAVCETESNAALFLGWVKDLGGAFNCSPAVGPDGTVYVADEQNVLYALNPLTGGLIWQNAFGASNNPGWFPTSSPTVASDGSIYLGSRNGYLYKFHPDGSIVWSTNVGYPSAGADLIATAALSSDERNAYVGIYNGDGFSALDISGTNASPEWIFNPTSLAGMTVASSAAVASDGSIYFLPDEHHFFALNPDGNVKWYLPVPSEGAPSSSPCLDAEGNIYFGSEDGYLYSMSAAGAMRWVVAIDSQSSPIAVSSSPAIGPDGTVYVGTREGNVVAVTSNGQILGSFAGPDNSQFLSSPAVADDGTVYIGSGGWDGAGASFGLYALTNGVVKWFLPTTYAVNSSPTIAPDGIVYFATENGDVYALPGSALAAESPWPMFHQNARHTGLAPTTNCCSDLGPTFIPNNPGGGGTLASFQIYGPPGSNFDIYMSPNLTTWTFLSNVDMGTYGTPESLVTFTDYSAGAGRSNRFYQIRAGSYCSDIIGYVNISLAQGPNLIANPLCQITETDGSTFSPENSLSTWGLFLQTAGLHITNNVSIAKWDGANFQTNTYHTVAGLWTGATDETLLPGQSQFFIASAPTTVTFGGRVPRGTLVNAITAQTNYLSSILPVAGYLHSNLGYVPAPGDIVQLYAAGTNTPTVHTYSGGVWSHGEPYLSVGQGFVLITTNISDNWQTNFSVCAGE